MRIIYQTEQLHHALHPLFLTVDPAAEWLVKEEDQEADWYFAKTDRFFLGRTPLGNVEKCKDLYALKRCLYDYYRQRYGLNLPWGIISGIRPTKLARQILERNPQMDLSQFQEHIWELDRVSPEKAKLLWQVLVVENQCMNCEKTKEKEVLHLYLGIPFCPSRCYYCSFSAGVVNENDSKLKTYVELLKEEIKGLKPFLKQKYIRSIYFGGGTPTILKEELLVELLDALAEVVDITGAEEFTVEAGRPDTISPAKLDILKDYGVGRISINPQSFSNRTLAGIGRHHSVEQVFKAYEWAKEREFLVNMDLIFGLNGESILDVEDSVRQIRKLRPENITVHTLTPKRGADLTEREKQEMVKKSKGIGEMLEIWYQHMMAGGWQPYYLYRQKNIYFENVGYALPGTECIYNMETMLERQSVLALGAGSISKKVEADKISRYDMPKELTAYSQAIKQNLSRKLNFFEV